MHWRENTKEQDMVGMYAIRRLTCIRVASRIAGQWKTRRPERNTSIGVRWILIYDILSKSVSGGNVPETG